MYFYFYSMNSSPPHQWKAFIRPNKLKDEKFLYLDCASCEDQGRGDPECTDSNL